MNVIQITYVKMMNMKSKQLSFFLEHVKIEIQKYNCEQTQSGITHTIDNVQVK
jgi:hypothetical protein